MANYSNKRGHRGRIEINFKQLEKLCHIQCTEREIADWFHCSIDTVERRVREKFGISFAEYFGKKRVGGLVSLRRSQFRLAEKNPAMAIFLGKNYLGQADRTEIGNPPGESFRVEHNAKGKLISILNRMSARTREAEGDKKTEPEGS